jgi:hypothetical protein
MSDTITTTPPAKPPPALAAIRDRIRSLDRYLLEQYSRAQVLGEPTVEFPLAEVKQFTTQLTLTMLDLETLMAAKP